MTPLLLLLSTPSLAATLTVDPADSSAYETIKAALEDAEDGDTIDVVAGSFDDCLVIEKIALEITGAGAAATVLDGNDGCDGLISLDKGASLTLSGVTVTNRNDPAIRAEDSTLVLDAVTIEDSGDSTSYYYGGAAVIVEGSELTVTDSTFRDNDGYYGGHLTVNGRSTANVSNTTFADGYGVYGGAIFVDGISELNTEDCTFSDHLAYYYGGALYVAGQSKASSTGDTWTDNDSATFYSYGQGGAVMITEFSTFSVTGGSFTGNRSVYGGAMHADGYSSLTLSEVGFEGNESSSYGGALDLSEASATTDAGSVYTDNTSGYGGAVMARGSSLYDATGGTWSGNSSTGEGGAIYYYDDAAGTVDSGDFSGNTASTSGGAVRVYSVSDPVTLRNSTFVSNTAGTYYGGAIDAQYGDELVIEGSTFEDNVAGSYGGAVTAWYGTGLTVRDSSFDRNVSTGGTGGAISYYDYYDYYSTGSALSVRGSSFTDNQAGYDGGALTATYSNAVDLEDNLFHGNTAGVLAPTDAYQEGGAVYMYANVSASVHRNTFCGNEAGSGGAVYVYYDTEDSFTNNLFLDNVAFNGGALEEYYTGYAAVVNNTFAGNYASSYGSALWLIYGTLDFINNAVVDSGGTTAVEVYDSSSAIASILEYDGFDGNFLGDGGGAWEPDGDFEGHVFDDPLFVDWSDDGDCTNDDLRLGAGSPFRDAGDPSILDGDGTRSDIGAYGGPEAEALDMDGDGYTTADDCDDFDPLVNPGATEVCNGLDDDCEGTIDGEDAVDIGTWYTDADGDGWGVEGSTTDACDQPLETAAQTGDCDDTDRSINPDAVEIPDDGIDQDCDGSDSVTPGEGDDTGVGGEGKDDGKGCGCSSGSSAPVGLSWLLLLPGLVMLRRRRD